MAETQPAAAGPTPPIGRLADVRRLLSAFSGPDSAAIAACRAREAQLTKPAGALGRLEGLSEWVCAWQGRHPPRLERVRAVVFAGNHGVAARGVSAYPASVTVQMVAAFRAERAAVNQLCRTFGVELAVHPLDLDRPTADITEGPAMTEDECAAAFACGFAAAATGGDLLCVGEMGIANTTAAAALAMALYGGNAEDWTGPGTGVHGEARQRKVAAVRAAVDRHAGDAVDPIDLLRRLGGRELAAMTGAVAAARLVSMPVLLDGFVACAAAAVLAAMRPDGIDHCRVAHVSAEPGHRRLLDWLDQRPLLDLEMRLGEASGAVLAVGLVRAAVACHLGMATFGEAGVSGPAGP
jgi:nicotinate-nucleotide--dimethylbenzimidazole phosphoribosyltransferase